MTTLLTVIIGFLLLSCAGSKKSPAPSGSGGKGSAQQEDSDIAKLQRQLQTLEGQEKNSRLTIAQLKSQLDSLAADPGQLSAESIDKMRKQIEALEEAQPADNSEQIAELQAQLAGFPVGVDHSTELTKIKEKLQELQKEQDANDQALQDLNDALSGNAPANLSLPTVSAYLTHAGADFFRGGLVHVITFSNMSGISNIEQETDFASGSVDKMPTTEISFMFKGAKYCASIALTNDNFVSYKDRATSKDKEWMKNAKNLEVSLCPQ